VTEPAIKIELPQEHLEALVQQWVLQQLDDGKREEIITQAIAHLMAPQKDRYGSARNITPLQEAFNLAISQAVHRIAREMIDNNEEVQNKMRLEMGKAIETFFTTSYDAPGSLFGQKLAEAFSAWWCEYRS